MDIPRIDMQGVDTIVSLSQIYVNFNLNRLLTSDGTLSKVTLTYGQNTLQGQIASLSVDFGVSGSTQKVALCVAFASGKIEYYDLGHSPPIWSSADISDLKIGFDVDLSLKDLGDNPTLPADVKASVKAQIDKLGAGAFTILQILMVVTEAALSAPNPDLTQYPSNFPAGARAMLPIFLGSYLGQVAAAGGSTLGYALKVQNPGGVEDPVASFPPKELMLVTNPYHPNKLDPNKPDPEEPGLNALNWLMMCADNAAFPANLRPWWGNFILPDDAANSIYGRMAMSGELFLKYLLAKLGPVACTYVSVGNSQHQLAPVMSTKVGSFTSNGLGGTFSASNLSGKSHVTNTWSNDDMEYRFDFNVALKIIPQSNTITITRTTTFYVSATHWAGIENAAIKYNYCATYEIPATYTITIGGVDDGALQVNVTVTSEAYDKYILGDPYNWLVKTSSGSLGDIPSVYDTLGNAIDSAVEAAVPAAVPQALKAAIEETLNVHPFVFPGGAQLSMKAPVFDETGNLLVGLSYKA